MPGVRTFKLVGPRKGESVRLGNFNFVDGALQVPDNDVVAVGAILTRFYSAVPAEEFEAAQAAYEAERAPAKPAESPKSAEPTKDPKK